MAKGEEIFWLHCPTPLHTACEKGSIYLIVYHYYPKIISYVNGWRVKKFFDFIAQHPYTLIFLSNLERKMLWVRVKSYWTPLGSLHFSKQTTFFFPSFLTFLVFLSLLSIQPNEAGVLTIKKNFSVHLST